MISPIFSKGFTGVGKRTNNEDFIAPDNPNSSECIFVVCDGMGGHGHGEVASRVVAQGFYERLHTTPLDVVDKEYLQRILQQVQGDLNRANISDNEKKMGTTIVVVVIKKDRVIVGHIGDSRLYLLRTGKCEFRTIDHSLVEEAVQANIIREDQVKNHPLKGQLTQCLQPYPEVPAYLKIDELKDIQADDILLIVTDGVVDTLTIQKIEQLSISVKDDEFINQLCEYCASEGSDNYSGFYIRLHNEDDVCVDVKKEPIQKNKLFQWLMKHVINKSVLINATMIVISLCVGFIIGRGCDKNSAIDLPTCEKQMNIDASKDTNVISNIDNN